MIIIDPSKGGTDSGVSGNGIIEKDFNLLISKYIYDRLKDLGANVTIIRDSDETLNDEERSNKIKNVYGNNSNVLTISNILNSGGGEGAEIVYALRNNDRLAEIIASNLSDAGRSVNKWYQRRNLSDTSKDFYNIQKDTGNIETIVVNYGYVDNVNDASKLKNNYEEYGEAIVKSIANYKGIPYYQKGSLAEVYTVKKGDSLYSIAKKYNISVDDIKNYNNLSSNLLSIGQTLSIPNKKEEENIQVSESTYVVQKGDSLYKIANKFGTTVDKLKELNNLSNNLINVGQILVIDESYVPSYDETTYVVKKGDSLYSIANRYGITVSDLKSANNLSSNLLSIGQILKLPSLNIYIVQKGDSLYSIAKKYNTTVDKIKEKNKLNSNLLSIGQQLIV